MNADFASCLAFTLGEEGGFVDDAEDPGGATNLGITLATLSSWRGRPCTIADVENLTEADVGPIYLARYFNAAHANDCPAGVDLMVFEESVNQGVGRAIESLQMGAGVVADGAVGPKTLAAVNSANPSILIDAIAKNREDHYRALPTFPRFGRGWLSRLARAKTAAHAMLAP